MFQKFPWKKLLQSGSVKLKSKVCVIVSEKDAVISHRSESTRSHIHSNFACSCKVKLKRIGQFIVDGAFDARPSI